MAVVKVTNSSERRRGSMIRACTGLLEVLACVETAIGVRKLLVPKKDYNVPVSHYQSTVRIPIRRGRTCSSEEHQFTNSPME